MEARLDIMPNGENSNMVRKYRRWNELSQTELAEKVGVSRQTIANIERGNYSPSVHLALDICRILGQSVESVFGLQQQQEISPERNGSNVTQ